MSRRRLCRRSLKRRKNIVIRILSSKSCFWPFGFWRGGVYLFFKEEDNSFAPWGVKE